MSDTHALALPVREHVCRRFKHTRTSTRACVLESEEARERAGKRKRREAAIACVAERCSVHRWFVVRCGVLCVSRCVAVCCGVLRCVAVYCGVLECVAVCCSVVQCDTMCCSILQCNTVCCRVLQCNAVRCSALQCVAGAAVRCGALQCVAVCYRVLQY